jgi:hypothetical protein
MIYGKPVALTEHCKSLIEAFGSVRAASNKLDIDYAYLHRLASGEKTEPSDAALEKLGLAAVRTTHYFKLGGQG